MIHYNLWFNLRSDVEEQKALSTIYLFLRELTLADDIAGFQLLRNSGNPGKTKLLPFQALIEFQDDAQFASAFSAHAARGIHTGLRGRVMELVCDFHVEVFKQLTLPSENSAPASPEECYRTGTTLPLLS